MFVHARHNHFAGNGRAKPHAVFMSLSQRSDRLAAADDYFRLAGVALHQAGDTLACRQNAILLTHLIFKGHIYILEIFSTYNNFFFFFFKK
jgi:hypothetical protein